MQLSAYRYRFPFIQTFATGSNSFSEREGLILRLNHNGIRAVGEAAPLPGFSNESLDEVIGFVADHSSEIHSFIAEQTATVKPAGHSLRPDPPASLAFGLDTLIADYRAKRQQCSLQDLLFDRYITQIPVNATLSIGTTGETLNRTEEFWKQGYRTFKIKLGKYFDRELAVVQQLRNKFPEALLRIDANQSWVKEQAIANLKRLEPYRIEYCEEPIQDPTVSTLREIRAKTEIPIAIDESLYKQPAPHQWIAAGVADILILKPMIMGAFQKNFETCRLADDHDYRVILTSALESGIGRWMAAVLAAGAGSREMAHGLATGHLLAMDVWTDQHYIENGTLKLPGGPGLTVDLQPGKPGSGLKQLDLF